MSKIEALEKEIKILKEEKQLYAECCLQAQNASISLKKQMEKYEDHMSLIRRTAMFIHNCENQLTVQEQKFLSMQIMDLCKLAEKAGK